MTILIAAAFSGELAALFSRFPRTPRSQSSDLALLSTAPSEVWTVSLGMGPTLAPLALQEALAALPKTPALLILTGCCGALIDDLRAGALVLPERIASTSGAPPITLPAEAHASALARLRALEPYAGSILTSPSPIDSASAKMALAERHQAIAVDMESHPCARLAEQKKIPTIVLRAVVDRLHDSVPDFPPRFDPNGRPQILPAAAAVLRRPWLLPSLLSAAPRFAAAQKTIAQAAEILFHSQHP